MVAGKGSKEDDALQVWESAWSAVCLQRILGSLGVLEVLGLVSWVFGLAGSLRGFAGDLPAAQGRKDWVRGERHGKEREKATFSRSWLMLVVAAASAGRPAETWIRRHAALKSTTQ